MKNKEKLNFSNKKGDLNYIWKQTQGDMSFYNYNITQNYPLIINFPKSKSKNNYVNFNNNKNIIKYNNNEEEEEDYNIKIEDEEKINKQNFDEKHFFVFLKQKRLNKIYPKQEIEGLLNKKTLLPKQNNLLRENIPLKKKNENEDFSIDKLLNQLINTNDIQNKSKIIQKLLIEKKTLHKEKLENFYKEISNFLKEKIEDVKEWISLEEKFMKIENLTFSICKELTKYIKIQQSEKIQSENITSKDFLRIHFIGSIKVKMNDFNLTLKSYK